MRLLVILIFFSNIVWAEEKDDRTRLRENGTLNYYHYPQLGGDGSLDDALIELSEEPKHKETKIRIINTFELQQKFRAEAEEEMRDFEDNGY